MSRPSGSSVKAGVVTAAAPTFGHVTQDQSGEQTDDTDRFDSVRIEQPGRPITTVDQKKPKKNPSRPGANTECRCA